MTTIIDIMWKISHRRRRLETGTIHSSLFSYLQQSNTYNFAKLKALNHQQQQNPSCVEGSTIHPHRVFLEDDAIDLSPETNS
ncbi:hypothetical protein NC651_000386 [Populus alba x Populus x berolinensis]|nr:hypothetical protein NC651_000386 [Populus alba x Populus x berolinensis]